MRQRWDDYERAGDYGPLALVMKVLVFVVMVSAAIWGISQFFRAADDAANVAHEQFGAHALLQKYEWFKDASAALDKKQADIAVYQNRLTTLIKDNAGLPRSKWAREDREQSNIWQSELAGVRASYNELAAQYNAEMSKFNWRFANAGQLPEGATKVLPREYKPYETE